eukprot:11712959-Alexandrium_andersonii.AAC.1
MALRPCATSATARRSARRSCSSTSSMCSDNEHVEKVVQDMLDMNNTMRLAEKYEPKAKQDE